MANIERPIWSADGQTLSNVLVDNKSATYNITSTWYDGSPMDDSKLDNDLVYVKYDGEYLVRNLEEGQVLQKDTMNDMRNLSTFETLLLKMGIYKHVQLNGYYEKGDTPEPINYRLSDTNDDDDGGSVIETQTNIKLFHNFGSVVRVQYFGIREQNSDNTPNLLNLLDYLPSFGGRVLFPEGRYEFEESIVFPKITSTSLKGVSIEGQSTFSSLAASTSVNSRGQTVFIYKGSGVFLDMVGGSNESLRSQAKISDINIYYEGSSEDTICIKAYDFSRGKIHSIGIRGFNVGVEINNDIYYSILENISVNSCTEVGIRLNGLVNGSTLYDVKIQGCPTGMELTGAGRSVNIVGGWIEDGDTGIRITRTRQVTVVGTYFEKFNDSTIFWGNNPNETSVLNLHGISLAIDRESGKAIAASYQSEKTANIIGCTFANRSSSAISVIQPAGGTVESVPLVNYIGNTWFDGTPLPIYSPSLHRRENTIEMDGNGINIGNSNIFSGSLAPDSEDNKAPASLYLRETDDDRLFNNLWIKKPTKEGLEYQPVVQIRSGSTEDRPTSHRFLGEFYFDTDLQKSVYWNGNSWEEPLTSKIEPINNVTTPDATDEVETQNLVNELKSRLNNLLNKMRDSSILED